MSTLLWPPIYPSDLIKEEEATLARELEWLLGSLQETLQSLKAGLEECVALLAPTEHGSTLVLSSLRSETLKGFVTRIGTRIVKGDIHLRLPSLPLARGASSFKLSISSAPTAPTIVLEQLQNVRTLINGCLDVVDATCWTGNANDANFIWSQMRLLHENIQEAKASLKGSSSAMKPWYEDAIDERSFDPPLLRSLSLHLSITDAALVLYVRTLELVSPATGTNTPLSLSGNAPSYSSFSIRDRLSTALGGQRQALHDEAHEAFSYRGQDVRVRDKVRVESQDPSLMAAFAKLSALDRILALSRRALTVVMGKEDEEDDGDDSGDDSGTNGQP